MVLFSVGNTGHCLRRPSSTERAILHALISIELHWIWPLAETLTHANLNAIRRESTVSNLKPISCSLKWAVLLLLISFFKAKLSGDSNLLTNLCSVSALIGSLRLEFAASFFSARATKRGQKLGYVVMHKIFCAKRKCLHVWKKKTVWLKNRNSIGGNEEVGSGFLVTS